MHLINAFYHLVQNHLPSSLLPKNVKIKIHRTVTTNVVLYGCENWFLTRREEHRLSVFEIMVLRMISGAKWEKEQGNEKDYIMSRFIICTFHKISFEESNK
jgi:hypothetical protein